MQRLPGICLRPCETLPLQQRLRETLNKIVPRLKAVRCKIVQRKLRQPLVVMRSKASKREDSP
jgi:hypothetical protein